MKKAVKGIAGVAAAALVSFGALSLSCKVNKNTSSLALAETPEKTLDDSLDVTMALQNRFRKISSEVLPAVVEVDVTETTKVRNFNPFKDFEFFFGNPRENRGDREEEFQERKQQSLGSGVVVRRNGNTVYVLTNNHVAGNATSIKIKMNDEREFDGKLVGADERMDIALVSFETTDKTIAVASLGDSDAIQQGDIVLALGSPLGYFASVTQGIVSATGRSGGQIGSISDFIQTDAAINQGNSGGPLVNIKGEVIGINTWIASQSGGSQGLGFSIPINNIKTAIDQFISKGKIAYGWMGVSLSEITEDYKEALGLDKKANGAFASQIFIGSPAIKGGLLPGDFIIEIDGRPVKSVDQLVREVGGIPAGKSSDFTVLRGKSKISLTVKIEERKKEISADNTKLWPGFMAAPLTDDARKQLKIDNKNVKGVIATGVLEKSAAAALKIQNNDIITAVNDVAVTNAEEFYRALDLTDKKEIWFDLYSEGHSVSTGHYKFPAASEAKAAPAKTAPKKK